MKDISCNLISVLGTELLPGDIIFMSQHPRETQMSPLYKGKHFLVLQSRQNNNRSFYCLTTPGSRIEFAYFPLDAMYLIFRGSVSE